MRIFSFPHVVIYELMEQFRPVQLVALSFCSKKAHALVKRFSNIKDGLEIRSIRDDRAYELSLPGGALIRVALEDNEFLDTLDLKTHQGFKYSFDRLGCCNTSWEDVVHGCRESTNYICNLFKIPVSNVIVGSEEDLWLLDFVQQRQEHKMKEVLALETFPVSAEGYSRMMSSNATESIDCLSCPPGGYRFGGKLPSAKELLIAHAYWITREHLLGLESQNAQLWTANLTMSDVNALLKSWLNGGLPNLKYLYLSDIKSDNQANDDLAERLEPVQEEVYYMWHRSGLAKPFNTDAFHIRRDDGVVASVHFGRSFWMAVWPDLDGKCV